VNEPPDTEEHNVEVEPNPEPEREPFDSHQGPLDNDDDARHLRADDPRRAEVLERRGSRFLKEGE
jgi:hypothetical protein